MKEAERVISELEWFRSVLIKGGKAPEYYEAQSGILAKAIKLLEQPEIVKCKNCKYYGGILYSDTQFEYGECFGHEESDYTFEVKPYDFCSRGERKADG